MTDPTALLTIIVGLLTAAMLVLWWGMIRPLEAESQANILAIADLETAINALATVQYRVAIASDDDKSLDVLTANFAVGYEEGNREVSE